MTPNDLNLKSLASAAEADRRARAAAGRLAGAAADHDLLDVAVARVDSPIGELFVAVTPRGLVCVAFEDEDRDEVLVRLARELSPRILEHTAAVDDVRRELDQYFEGERHRFDLRLDRRLIHGIARDV
ncbi:MAG: methylated-DNA--[protein]-cysteine S-methyltransferase, partial [Actinomycetota bacterium]